MDDISWWAEGKDDQAVVVKLSKAVVASIDWAASNGVAFDHSKMEAAIFPEEEEGPYSHGHGGCRHSPVQ